MNLKNHVTASCLIDPDPKTSTLTGITLQKTRSARTSAAHVSFSSDLIVKQRGINKDQPNIPRPKPKNSKSSSTPNLHPNDPNSRSGQDRRKRQSSKSMKPTLLERNVLTSASQPRGNSPTKSRERPAPATQWQRRRR